MPLNSLLQFCDGDDSAVVSGLTRCIEQVIYGLPPVAELVSHQLLSNGTATPLTAGTSAQLVRGPADAAAVRFSYTFLRTGVQVLQSISVFSLNGSTFESSTGGGRALSNSTAVAPVRIEQRAYFDVSPAADAGARTPDVLREDELFAVTSTPRLVRVAAQRPSAWTLLMTSL